MKIVTIASLLPAVGRSTLAFHGAFCLPAACVLTDDATMERWLEARQTSAPSVRFMSSVNAGLAEVAHHAFDHVIVDARTSEKNLYWSFLRSDLVLIPTRPDRQGFERAREVAELATSLGVDFKIVVTMARSLGEAEKAIAELAPIDDEPKALTYSSLLLRALGQGKSIFEWSPDCLAAVEMSDLWTSVFFRIHEPASLNRLRGKADRLAALHNPFDR